MDIDERLERLAERHEALTQSVEMLLLEGREQDKRIDRLDQKLSGQIEKVSSQIGRLVGLVETLTDIVKTHEDRLNGFQGTA